jgi:hypothetical protein
MASQLLSDNCYSIINETPYTDHPVIFHTLVDAGMHRDEYLCEQFVDTELPHGDFKLRWLHIPGYDERILEVKTSFDRILETAR